MKKGTPVGVDSCFAEICVGDVIRDADGKRYTVDEFGRAKPLNGVDNVVPLKALKDVMVENERDSAMAEQSKFRAITRHVEERKARIAQDYGIPASNCEVSEPKPASRLDEFKKGLHPGGRPNTSGLVRIYGITRSTGASTAEIRRLAAENGIEILRNDGKPAIRTSDHKRMLSLVRDSMRGKGKKDPAPSRKDPDPARKDDSPPDGGPGSSVEEILRPVEDSELAQELRRRGWEVTAIKRL